MRLNGMKMSDKMIISEDEYVIMKEWMRKYIDEKCIFRQGDNWEIDCREDKSFMAAKRNTNLLPPPLGKCYTWQFYLRRGCFDSTFNSILSQMFIYQVERTIGHFNFQLSGLETAATPMLSAIPLVARNFGIELNSFLVKKEQKRYGIRNWIEGQIKAGVPVLIIDDLISRTSSIKQCNDLLTIPYDNIETMDYVFAIVNKYTKHAGTESYRSKDRFKGFGNTSTMYCDKIPGKKIMYLFDCDDFDLIKK